MTSSIDEKFIESFDVSEWEVETDTGWEDIVGSHKTIQYQVYKVTVDQTPDLLCADDHIVFDSSFNEVFVKDLKSGDLIQTKNGLKKVLSVEDLNYSDNMYDLEVNSPNHRYYTNDILSHNTTVSAAVLLWYVIFNDSYSVAILANKLSTAREILTRLKRAFENLPKWLQQGVTIWNKTDIAFENGSSVIAASTSSSAIRSKSINMLYLDEFAFVPRNIQEDFFTSVYPTIVSGTTTKIVISSTPNGFDLFYKLWTNSVENRNEYKNFSVDWWDVPGRDEAWKIKTISNTSEEQFRQEFLAEFLGSSNTLISSQKIGSLTFISPTHTHNEGSLTVYDDPKKGRIYFMVVDTARGTGNDASAFLVIDVTEIPYKVVCAYKDTLIDPLFFPDVIFQVATHYNEAFVLVEINDNGQQIADILHQDLEYDNVVFTSVKGRAGQVINAGFGSQLQRGVRTTKQVKRIGCSNAKTMIENDKIILNDYNLINELSTFIQKGQSYEAEIGAHDDLIMCVVLFAWATSQNFFKEVTNTDFRKKLMEDREKMIDDDLMPFGILDDGTNEEDINQGQTQIPWNENAW